MDSQQAAHMINLLREIAVELRLENNMKLDGWVPTYPHTEAKGDELRSQLREALK